MAGYLKPTELSAWSSRGLAHRPQQSSPVCLSQVPQRNKGIPRIKLRAVIEGGVFFVQSIRYFVTMSHSCCFSADVPNLTKICPLLLSPHYRLPPKGLRACEPEVQGSRGQHLVSLLPSPQTFPIR